MNTELRFLMIENDPNDLELISRTLKKGFNNCIIKSVEAKAELLEILDTNTFDLILSDYNLPDMDGFEALEIVLDKTIRVPFIIVSGTIGEANAIEIMRKGASNFVFKNELFRLNLAIEQALRDYQTKQDKYKYQLALVNSELRYRNLFENNGTGIMVINREGNIELVNNNFTLITGFSNSELAGKPLVFELVVNDEISKNVEIFKNRFSLAEKSPYSFETRIISKDGIEKDIIVLLSVLPDTSECIYSLSDISSFKNSERKIKEQLEIINKATDGIVVTDLVNTITFWNNGATKILGWTYDEAINKNISDLLKVEASTGLGFNIDLVQLVGNKWAFDNKLINKNGDKITVHINSSIMLDQNGIPVSILSIIKDISEKKILEQQHLRSQRLETLGAVASGMVHDLNNIFTPILLVATYLQQELKESEMNQFLNDIVNSTNRGVAMIKQILAYSRGFEEIKVAMNVKHMIRELIKIITETFPKNIKTNVFFGANLSLININPTHFDQVILNLLINARDAMSKGGEINISCEDFIPDQAFLTCHNVSSISKYVCIKITDTGSGIDEEMINKIFDQFYTTKVDGTGLGLATVRKIIENYNGIITVSSIKQEGTSFSVYLPASSNDLCIVTDKPKVVFIEGKGRTILIVDDETQIRDTLKISLEHHGFKVITAVDGNEGFELFNKATDKIDLVITDLLMPNTDGLSLLQQIQTLSPDTKLLIMSGKIDPELEASLVKKYYFLRKPFSFDSLIELIDDILKQRV